MVLGTTLDVIEDEWEQGKKIMQMRQVEQAWEHEWRRRLCVCFSSATALSVCFLIF